MSEKQSNNNQPRPKYKSNLIVYLVISGIIYVIFNTYKTVADQNGYLKSPWICGVYFFVALMVMVVAYYRIAKKGDEYIKKYHHDLYDRFYNVLVTGKKEIKRPLFIGLQTMTNTDYEDDYNLKAIRKEAKLYACALAIIFILTLIQVL